MKRTLLFSNIVIIFLLFVEACNTSKTSLTSYHRDSALDSEFPDTLVEGTSGLCGNGVAEESEECDDGNRLDCDGCSRDCLLETGGCETSDTGTDADADAELPPPTSPISVGDPIPVDQSPEEGILGMEWLHIMWTGEYFSFIFLLQCVPDSRDDCIAMRRFGKDGMRIRPDWVYMPADPNASIYRTFFNSDDISSSASYI